MLMRGFHLCLAGCHKVITWKFAICTDCELLYGSSSLVWPEWLRFLWKDEQKRRRQQRNINRHELDVDLMDIREFDNGKIARNYPKI